MKQEFSTSEEVPINHIDAASAGDEPRAPAFSDEALALRFAEVHGNDLRYVADWNRWLRWDGTRWQFDRTLFAFALARKRCRRAAAECNANKTKNLLASAKTVNAVVTLARADQRIAATADQWDADPWLLNTPAGIVDLRTGELSSHRPEYYMTKIACAIQMHPVQSQRGSVFSTASWVGILR